MIKFFRNIRQRLVKENKFSKYLLYAIGEIILVVIGILIALTISDWNSKRQLNNNNQVYLKKMLQDLDATEKRLNLLVYDRDSIKNDYPSLEEAVQASDSILTLTYVGLNASHLEYLMTAPFSSGNALLNITDNTYVELSNTGKLYSLGSESLVAAITTYYKEVEREQEYNKGNSRTVTDGFIKFEDGFGMIGLDYYSNSSNFNLNKYPFYSDKNSKEYKNYQLGMSMIGSGQYTNMTKMKRIIGETLALKELINNELRDD